MVKMHKILEKMVKSACFMERFSQISAHLEDSKEKYKSPKRKTWTNENKTPCSNLTVEHLDQAEDSSFC